MNRKQRTKEELIKASEHLLYEVWMFTSLTRGMASGVFNEGVINNALLESFTIHARVLLDFLFAENPRQDDVIAEDYLPSLDEWVKIKAAKSEKLENIYTRVGKEVAHLTYVRQTIVPQAKGWNFIEIANEINSVFNSFLALVPKNLLSLTWQKSIKEETPSSNSYFVYENWVAEGHKARIHFGHCSFCNFGQGMHGTENETHGRWLGPFSSFNEALDVATETKGNVTQCKHCAPH
ncbi:MAG: hypothetical protein U0X74_08725 [Anaerolineales bacterium]